MTTKQKRNRTKLSHSALAFYIKLYCEKKGSTETKSHNKLIEATKSWISLSEDEKQQFHSKFKECEEKYKLNICSQLKNAEPFMKVKRTSIRHDDASIINVEKSDSGDLPGDHSDNQPGNHPDSQPEDYSDNQPENLAPDTEIEPIEAIEQSAGSEAADIQTLDSHDYQDEQNKNEVETADKNTETPPILIEPIPPTIKTGHQLYHMLNSTNENNTWATLPQFEKNRYSRAVAIMKKDYISKYKEYLLSLTPKQLFDYYNANI